MWAVKLRFLLTFENMLKSITAPRSECTAKQKNKVSYNTDYILSNLIDFLAMIEKRSKRTLKKEIFIFV